VIGLAISIPLIIFGSTLLLKVMERFPIIITLGAALLGFLAGEMLLTDPAVSARFGEQPHDIVNIAGAIGAVIVVAVGLWMQRRTRRRAAELADREEAEVSP
jgi:predicted tellurium resistance membrane protein TerC